MIMSTNKYILILIRTLLLIIACNKRTGVTLDIVIPGAVMNYFSKKNRLCDHAVLGLDITSLEWTILLLFK